MHGERAQAVVKIFAQFPFGDSLFNVGLGGGQDAHIHLDPAARRPGWTKYPCRSTCSSLTCRLIGISVISSRNSVPLWHNSSLPGRLRPLPLATPKSSLSSTSPGRSRNLA